MKDDKFEKLSDKDMDEVIGGVYTIKRNDDNIFRKYEIQDKDGEVCKKCLTRKGARRKALRMCGMSDD